jgi:hypothetical protein
MNQGVHEVPFECTFTTAGTLTRRTGFPKSGPNKPTNGGTLHIIRLAPAAAITLDRFRRVFISTPDQQLRLATVKAFTARDTGNVVLALIQQPKMKAKIKEGSSEAQEEEYRATEMQPGTIWTLLRQGLGWSEADAQQHISVSRLSYIEKSKKVVTDSMVVDYLIAEAVERDLQEHSLPTVNGLAAVTASATEASERYVCSAIFTAFHSRADAVQ